MKFRCWPATVSGTPSESDDDFIKSDTPAFVTLEDRGMHNETPNTGGLFLHDAERMHIDWRCAQAQPSEFAQGPIF